MKIKNRNHKEVRALLAALSQLLAKAAMDKEMNKDRREAAALLNNMFLFLLMGDKLPELYDLIAIKAVENMPETPDEPSCFKKYRARSVKLREAYNQQMIINAGG